MKQHPSPAIAHRQLGDLGEQAQLGAVAHNIAPGGCRIGGALERCVQLARRRLGGTAVLAQLVLRTSAVRQRRQRRQPALPLALGARLDARPFHPLHQTTHRPSLPAGTGRYR